MENKDLSPLPELDHISSKLDKLGNLIKYTGRGYRGFFDTNKHDLEKLDQLYSFDLGLFDQLESFKSGMERIQASRKNTKHRTEAVHTLHTLLDQFETIFSKRQDILIIK